MSAHGRRDVTEIKIAIPPEGKDGLEASPPMPTNHSVSNTCVPVPARVPCINYSDLTEVTRVKRQSHMVWSCNYQGERNILKSAKSLGEILTEYLVGAFRNTLAPDICPPKLLVFDQKGEVEFLSDDDTLFPNSTTSKRAGTYHILTKYIPDMELAKDLGKRRNRGAATPSTTLFFDTPEERRDFGRVLGLTEGTKENDFHLLNFGVVYVRTVAPDGTIVLSKRGKLFDSGQGFSPYLFPSRDEYKFGHENELTSPFHRKGFNPYNWLDWSNGREKNSGLRSNFPNLISGALTKDPNYQEGRFSVKWMLPFFKIRLRVVNHEGLMQDKTVAQIFVEAHLGTRPFEFMRGNERCTWQDHFTNEILHVANETEGNMFKTDIFRDYLAQHHKEFPSLMKQAFKDKTLLGKSLLDYFPQNIERLFEEKAEQLEFQLRRQSISVYRAIYTPPIANTENCKEKCYAFVCCAGLGTIPALTTYLYFYFTSSNFSMTGYMALDLTLLVVGMLIISGLLTLPQKDGEDDETIVVTRALEYKADPALQRGELETKAGGLELGVVQTDLTLPPRLPDNHQHDAQQRADAPLAAVVLDVHSPVFGNPPQAARRGSCPDVGNNSVIPAVHQRRFSY